ncbi:MAG: 30S ribosomal protein S4 [Clostridia bacterium]|nr:30S ribosomal protein S4 [Clostridia bacterium]MBR3556473.1 30S ribosomal protein S4 [Oscillospiraceae bacterium]
MAVNKQPIAKKCRSFEISPAVMGYSNKKSTRNPGGNTRRRKVSEYGAQLKEKQKVKFVYGILEKQFHHYFLKASNMRGITGDNMLRLLELRLDNVVYRLGFAKTRRQARQIVVHGHIRVNGQKVDIPSYQVKVDDVITLRKRSEEIEMFKGLREGTTVLTPKWLSFDAANLTGKVVALPAREDIDLQLQENMIVEYYSR